MQLLYFLTNRTHSRGVGAPQAHGHVTDWKARTSRPQGHLLAVVAQPL